MADTPGAAEGQRESARGKRENRKGRFLGFSAQKRCLCTSQSQTAQSLGVIGRQTQMPRAGGKKTSILTVGKEGVLASTELPENEVGAHMCPAGGPGALAELQGRRPLLWPASRTLALPLSSEVIKCMRGGKDFWLPLLARHEGLPPWKPELTEARGRAASASRARTTPATGDLLPKCVPQVAAVAPTASGIWLRIKTPSRVHDGPSPVCPF